jgi:hypothetical protein
MSSPIGEVFRARLRQFPSLVTCCTIDWFSAWPEEALQSVAASFLYELPELEASPTAMKGLVRRNRECVFVFLSPASLSSPLLCPCLDYDVCGDPPDGSQEMCAVPG